jgi:hypothetical protein
MTLEVLLAVLLEAVLRHVRHDLCSTPQQTTPTVKPMLSAATTARCAEVAHKCTQMLLAKEVLALHT